MVTLSVGTCCIYCGGVVLPEAWSSVAFRSVILLLLLMLPMLLHCFLLLLLQLLLLQVLLPSALCLHVPENGGPELQRRIVHCLNPMLMPQGLHHVR